MSRRVRGLPLLAAALLAACGGAPDGATGRGTIVIATAADAETLLPPLVADLVGRQVVDQLFEPLAAPPTTVGTVGDAGWTPRLATRWAWSDDSTAITFTLDPRARWHDGVPVRARDVRFAFALVRDSALASRYRAPLAGVDSVSVVDSLTVRAWFARRTPEQFFTFVSNLTVLPAHRLDTIPVAALRASAFARQPVGNGRFRFRRWVPGALLEVVADTAHPRGRPGVDRLVWSVSPDPATLWTKLVREEADVVEQLRGEGVAKVAAAPAARLVPYQGLDYAFVAFRIGAAGGLPAHPLLGDAGLRRALARAVDRRAIVANVFDTLAAPGIGPVVRAQWTADTAIAMPPFDRASAMALLDSLGWRAGTDGLRARDGRPLAFSLLVPASSAPRRQAAVLLQAQWKAIGAAVTIEELDFRAFVERIMAGRFDAMVHGLQADPSPADVRDVFGGDRAPEQGGGNFGRYASAEVDAALDSAAAAFDPARARALYQRAYARIIADAAGVFLYEPRAVAGVHRRLEVPPLPPMGWWTSLAEWRVTPGRHLARDEVPLVVEPPAPPPAR